MNPVAQAFLVRGYKSLVPEGVERRAPAFFPRAWATLQDHLPALDVSGVCSEGRGQI